MRKQKICKRLIVFTIAVAFIATLVNQEKILKQYSQEKEKVAGKIVEAEDTKERLEIEKEQVDTAEFIEQTAREKLDMYYPNEIVYMDIEK